MNTKDVLKRFKLIFSDLLCHPLFLLELQNLLSKDLSGKQDEFFKILVTQLNNINTFTVQVHKTDSNEILKGMDKTFYSIHLQRSQFNIRIIIYFLEDRVPLFLCAFNERAGKRQTDYTRYKAVLDSRLQEMLGDEDYE